MKKITKSFYVSERLWDQFQLTTNAKKESMSQVLEDFINEYCIKNKLVLDESIQKFWLEENEK
jgi:hypothetical protein